MNNINTYENQYEKKSYVIPQRRMQHQLQPKTTQLPIKDKVFQPAVEEDKRVGGLIKTIKELQHLIKYAENPTLPENVKVSSLNTQNWAALFNRMAVLSSQDRRCYKKT